MLTLVLCLPQVIEHFLSEFPRRHDKGASAVSILEVLVRMTTIAFVDRGGRPVTEHYSHAGWLHERLRQRHGATYLHCSGHPG